ncbi:DUF427 domain-containing protein [Cellulomonas oligotrophica]|uniref:Uncharacterized protein (DUF427 family) n=1 Tax=Cellulomonas oligotrophica TaxID=931536 RepID=A0A7Y9FIW3_9CELL|nr:DUF427 domain-containing protein [Cellulomonas oligotrophica]NYD87822.1 uncharacterized protein (DUF427 family) [Cellulomonas oligotrophica]GIG32972.1 hypothetical protein Col01nite_21310 [Cellulomonas oligotrophica]
MPTATLHGTVLAHAGDDEVVRIEGNVYFKPSTVRADLLEASPTPYTCPWKGVCQYWSVRDGDTLLADRAWSYPEPYPGAIERVGTDFAGWVAFWKEVEVS